MEEKNAEKESPDFREVRRSERHNKGIPPKRYADLNNAGLSSSIVLNDDQTNSYKSTAGKILSCKNQNEVDVPRSSSRKTESVVSSKIAKSYEVKKGVSVKSKNSSVSRLNIELTLMKKQKELDDEESRVKEKLKALERERQFLIKEAEVKRKIAEISEAGSVVEEFDVPSVSSEDMYQNPVIMSKWIDNVEQFKDMSLNNVMPEHSISSRVKYQNSVWGGESNNLLMDITRQCIENTATTNKILLRHKMRDLTIFSGELTEWPIFISEFKRSTNQLGLTDEDNLIRLDKALKGKARDTVKALLTSPRNVSKIMNMLEMNFGRAEWIILSLIDKARKVGVVREDKVDSWIYFSNAVNNMVTTMKNVNSQLYLFNPELLAELIDKLPTIQKFSWGKFKHHRDMGGLQTSLEDFADWFEEELQSITAISNPFQRNSSHHKNVPKKETVMVFKKNNIQQTEANECIFCKSIGHSMSKCKKFTEMTVAKRRENILSIKLCFLCLKVGHMASRCFSKTRCGIDGCKGRHHPLLHIQRDEKKQGEEEIFNKVEVIKSEDISSADFCASLTRKSSSNEMKNVLLRIAPVILRGPAGEIKTYALFDEGSTCTMIEEELANRLQLPGPVVPLCFQWTNEITHYEDQSQMVSVDVAAHKATPVFFNMKQVRTVKNLRLPCQKINVEDLSKKFPYLNHDVLESIRCTKPELLIGQDNCGLIVPRNIIQPKLNQPIMSMSKLGWTIHGPIDEIETEMSLNHISLCCRHVGDEELHQIVKDSFRLEAFGVKMQDLVIKSVEDKKALEIMKKTVKKIDGRYHIGHLWKDKDCLLPHSKANALKRLYCMERKMDHDGEFARQYSTKIAEYIQRGYAKKLNSTEIPESKKIWYLPHFAVWNINKPGKIRMVFDAAAKSQGSSLNDFLHQGPDFVPSLISVLWRFRQYQIAFGGDIKEMFHQVSIIEEDRCAQLFLWRGMRRNGSPDIYVMNAMIFGAISSPSVAQFVKNRNAALFESKYPGIVRAMEKQHYVDDYLDSCCSENDAIIRIKNVISVHKEAGFEMVKWISNSRAVMTTIPENLRADSQIDVEIDSKSLERVLGLSWSPKNDNFVFTLNLKKIPSEISGGIKVPTKREILRTVMSIFDPMGFLAPLMINARILLQNIWRNNISWDQAITEDLFQAWLRWLRQLNEITPVTIHRYYFPSLSHVGKVDLHLFCDASDKAYAAVAFLRTVEDGKIFTAFVTAKYKIAPLNQQTIPKLELQGAVLACRVAKTIRRELEYNIEQVHFWTDSMVVLQQIRSEFRRFPIFVACRLGEIHEDTNISQWHWVPSEMNIADQATKEIKNINLLPDGDWFSGPDFIKSPETDWPVEPKCSSECGRILVVNLDDTKIFRMEFPNISRFSKLNRLIRSTAWILYFVKVVKITKLLRPSTLQLDVTEIEEARMLWIKKSQGETFKEDIAILKRKKCLPRSSRLLKLSVFMDENFIIRLGGRIPDNEKLNIPFESRNPIVLDPNHEYTKLLIDQYHEESGHIGLETVVNNLRLKYWIINVRAAVKRSFKNCQACKNRKCKPQAPEMGLLPPERLEAFTFPFSFVGIDFFGPMTITVGRRNEKRYGVLFTCFTTRAIHIELAASLDTSSAILSIRRFMCRRGQPKEFRTDNGTNFVGAERDLRECIQGLDQNKIADDLALKGIIWKFNPPGAPHMGGIWERMIRSIKAALKISLKTIKPREEVLVTLLAEIEYIINSRPLTHISVDPREPEAITPNHFLLLRPGDVKSYGDFQLSSRKQWRIAQALADSYWRRWVLEYRPTLIQRQKWHDGISPVKIGDIVLIVDEKAPRNQWVIGRIEQTYPGKDGIIRVAKIMTNKGTFVRPVTKLCILPLSND